MSQTAKKSIRQYLLRNQIVVSLIVFGLITSILWLLLLTFANYLDHTRIVDLGKAIDTQARLTKSTNFLQHSLLTQVQYSGTRSVVLFGTKGNRVIASAGDVARDRATGWIVADQNVRNQVRKSLKSGKFGIRFRTPGRDWYAILPLSPQPQTRARYNSAQEPYWRDPLWYKKAEVASMSPGVLLNRIKSQFQANNNYSFQVGKDQYVGAIVIESNSQWLTTLAWRSLVFLCVLFGLGILTVLKTMSNTIRTVILKPINDYMAVIEERRSGNRDIRAQAANVSEFDKLANQWNSLLDYKAVAQQQNLVLSTLLEHVPVGIEVTDSSSQIEYANPAYLKMTGYSLAEVIGQTPQKLLKMNELDGTMNSDSLVALTRGKPWNGDLTFTHKNGNPVICNTTLVPIFDDEDNLSRIITVRHDITKIKNDARDLLIAKQAAESADKAKSEFLANMSHELRTPLNSIVGFAELMSNEKLGDLGNDDYREFASIIESSAHTLLSSINSILELSRLDTGSLDIKADEFDVVRVLHNIIEAKRIKTEHLDVTIIDCLGDSCHVVCDQGLFRKSINFLVCNAVKYNRDGGKVTISCKKKDGIAEIAIADTGTGIPQDQLEKVILPFHRVDNSFRRNKDGIGLGLTLVKKFTEAQNIPLEITSRVDVGTTVTLQVQLAQQKSRNIVLPLDKALVG